MPGRAHAHAAVARRLPRGWTDLGRQLLLFAGAYLLYSHVRGVADGGAVEAYANAREIIALEQSMNLFLEPAVHGWALEASWILDAASWTYVNSHLTVTFGALAWIYLRRNRSFSFVRNVFMTAMGVALAAYLLFPTAPPRFTPEWGLSDPVTGLTGVAPDSGVAAVLVNPFAAVPSMHVGFALMLGVPMSQMVRGPVARTLWLAYPVLVSFVVVVTANHRWFDVAAVAAVTAWAASGLVHAAPHAWAFGAREGGAPA